MDTSSKFLAKRRETLATEVRAEIERRILSGEIETGAKLNEVELATLLQVSRGTVREAIRSLADSGLIDLIANRGAYVRRLTIEEITNLYDLRGAIFAMACAAAAERVAAGTSGSLVDSLNGNLERMRQALKDEDHAAYYALNIQFHDMLMDAANNRRAKEAYDGVVKEMHLFRRRGLSLMTNIARSFEEHSAIVEAVAAGAPDQARNKALRHIKSGLKRFRATRSEADDTEATPRAAGT